VTPEVTEARRVAEKQAVAEAAAARLSDGMRLGVGSGSTLELFVPLLSARIRAGLRISCVATSNRIAALGASLGMTFDELDEQPLDLAIDGADEVDPQGQMVKGAGGAMVRERIVAAAARHFLVLVDSSKLVARLGERMPLPVEVQPFGLAQTTRRVAALMGETRLRTSSSGGPFVTDNAGRILDCPIPSGKTSHQLMAELRAIPGVVDAGFFLDFHPEVLVARDGRVDRFLGG
jgi:ribose 5-phosphate isomerase A